MFKLVRLMLALAHLMAKREEAKQIEKQKQFKKATAAKAKTLREAADRARVKADALAFQAANVGAASVIGCNDINEAQRVAGTLRSSLDYIVPAKDAK